MISNDYNAVNNAWNSAAIPLDTWTNVQIAQLENVHGQIEYFIRIDGEVRMQK